MSRPSKRTVENKSLRLWAIIAVDIDGKPFICEVPGRGAGVYETRTGAVKALANGVGVQAAVIRVSGVVQITRRRP